MMKIESNPVDVQTSATNIFAYLSDFNNFGKLMPPQITNWQSTTDTCSFTIENMATLAMYIAEKIEPTRLVIRSEAPSPFPFDLICEFEELSENSCRSFVQFHADMNPMLAMMVKTPLQNFINLLNEQLRRTFE
jgi:hypothetical protein